MSTQTTSGGNGGIGFVGVLTIVFVVLKLTDNIDWSWWWVLSPIWISALIAIAIFTLVFFVFLGSDIRRDRRKKTGR